MAQENMGMTPNAVLSGAAISREVGWNYHTAKTRTIEEARAAYKAAQKLAHNI